MLKDRNSFFSEHNMTSMNMSGPNMMMPNDYFSANSSVYAAPYPPSNNMYSDIDSRISKIERELKRLESRINRLENDGSNNINIEEYNSNPMYMV